MHWYARTNSSMFLLPQVILSELNLRFNISFPSSEICFFSSLSAVLIFCRAEAVMTMFSHSSFGCCFFEVKIST